MVPTPTALMYNVHRAQTHGLAARSNGNSSISSSTKLIIIATSASVGGLILAIVLFHLIRRCCRSEQFTPAPLPPPQQLAHQRERQVSQFFDNRNASASASRPSTWYDAQHLSARTLNPSASDTSLLPGKLAPSDSFVALNERGGSSGRASPLILPVPNPSFQQTSSSSLGSSETHSPTPPPETPGSSFSHSTVSSQPLVSGPRTRSSSTPRSRTHSRPVSLASSVTTMRNKGGTTIRGAPHGPHSNVQIVLPTPLAPQLNPYLAGSQRQSSYGSAMDRMSVVDKWAPVARSPAGPANPRRRSTSTPAGLRTSLSSPSHTNTHTHTPSHLNPSARRTSRHVSASASVHVPSIYHPVPHVPRIPSAYYASTSGSQLSISLIEDEEPLERGRSRTSKQDLDPLHPPP